MNNYTENDTFSFGDNENLFNNEVSKDVIDNSIQTPEQLANTTQINKNIFSLPSNPFVTQSSQQILMNSKNSLSNTQNQNELGLQMQLPSDDAGQFRYEAPNFNENINSVQGESNLRFPLDVNLNAQNLNENNTYSNKLGDDLSEPIQDNVNFIEPSAVFTHKNNSSDAINFNESSNEVQIPTPVEEQLSNIPVGLETSTLNQKFADNSIQAEPGVDFTPKTNSSDAIDFNESSNEVQIPTSVEEQFSNIPVGLETSTLNQKSDSNSSEIELIDNSNFNFELNNNSGEDTQNVFLRTDSENVVEEQPVVNNEQESAPSLEPETISMSNTDLDVLTDFKEEEKVKTTDIKSLFDRVGINVKEASDIFKRNTEMKEKIDSRFEELKKLQSEVSKVKKAQYDEINTYKEDVLSKLTSKKDEIELRLNKLKEFQRSLEKEKTEFEQYRKSQKEEIERIQKEVQDAYDNRREELKRIEDILRKQKDSLDEERNQLNLDKIQYESDKNELANNLLKFNEIVDSFTSGIDKIERE